MADSAVTSFFKNKKKAGVGSGKIKAFKVVPPAITANAQGSVTIEEGSTSTSTTFSSSNRRRVDDGWEEDIEDETPVGLLFHTDAGSKVAEIKDTDAEEPENPEIGELMERESAKAEFWNARKVAKAPKSKPAEEKVIGWREREAAKATTSLNNDTAFPSLGGTVKETPLAASVKPSVTSNCWNTLADDGADDENEAEESEKASVLPQSPSKKDNAPKKAAKETAAEKEAAENAALDKAIGEVKDAEASVVVDPRFANKKKMKKKKNDSDDEDD